MLEDGVINGLKFFELMEAKQVSLFLYRANESMPLLKCSYAVFSVLVVRVFVCLLYSL